jgi:hypothetical protein
MNPEVQEQLEGLFSGKYDVIVTPKDEGEKPINLSFIIRMLVSTVQKLNEEISELSNNKRQKVCV